MRRSIVIQMMDDRSSPMTLLSLAAKLVCVQLVYEWADGEMPIINVWRRGYHKDGEQDACPAHRRFLWHFREMQVPRFANIPSKVRYQIEDNIPPILEEVSKWILHHHLLNFFHDESSSSLSEYIVKLVWNHRFKIDNLATAKNIQTNDNLTPFERFKFASTYCLVDEIEKFRDTMDSVPQWESLREPLVGYWSRYLTNKLHTIVVPKNSSVSSIELWYLMFAGEHDLWSSAVYFFDKLDSVSKSNEFERILGILAESNLSDLLAKLATDKEWNLACRSTISDILGPIVLYGTLDQVRFIWKLFQSEIDSKNFCEIIEGLVILSMGNARGFEKWTSLLMEIWTSASSKLKQSAIVDTQLWQGIGYIITGRDTYDSRECRRQITDPMKFIRMVLNSIPAKQRITFFERNFCWLIVWAPFAAVDQLMRDVLKDNYNHDVVELKKVVANCSEIEWSRGILIVHGEFDELDTVVSFYFPGVDGITANNEVAMRNEMKFHKFKFILSDDVFDIVCFCVYRGDWKPLYEYVQKTVSWISPVGLEAIMKKVILQGKCWPRKIHKGEMNDLKEFVSTVYSNANPADRDSVDTQLKFLKKRYESYLLTALFDRNLQKKIVFDQANLKDFLLWIYEGDENLIDENFKQPSLFPRGFLVQLKGCVVEGSFRVTESMEEFLKWCFATEAERQQFKRQMIYDYRQYTLIEGLLMRREFRQRMLFWVFDDDVSLIEKFTADCVGYSLCPYSVSGYHDSDDSDDSDDED